MKYVAVSVGLFVVFTAASPALAQNITDRMRGATVVYIIGTRFAETYEDDGTWVRIATERHGTQTRITGKWSFITKKGRRQICWKMDVSGLESCRWYLRKGSSYYSADSTGQFPLDSLTFAR
jgi:hypothetical protein